MSQLPDTYTFQRYLSSKRTVDDRALNRYVWESLHTELTRRNSPAHTLTILEIGGGIGTMVERLLEEDRIAPTSYHLLDEQPDNITTASTRLRSRFGTSTLNSLGSSTFLVPPTDNLSLETSSGTRHELNLYTGDLFDFLTRVGSLNEVDLILAHAFMDLVDIPATLPKFTATLQPGTLLYFTINFDGATILEPTIDAAFDAHVEQVYHRTMDERITDGKPSGDSHTGRHLFHQMKTANIHTLAAGSSDWVIIPQPGLQGGSYSHSGSYPHDEGYFLHFIIDTMYGALQNHPDLDTQRFRDWIATRHNQVEQGELVYIAHQLDYLGEYQGKPKGQTI